jgi:hypothetical protein
MLQVLCQILQTENLSDVQSWLVSASDGGKLAKNSVHRAKILLETSIFFFIH